jgi:exonuclease SbcC
MAAELAERLADGGPCPVCGSTDHPGPAAHLADAVSAEDVDAAASRRDAAAEQRDQAQQARDELAAEAGEASATAGGATSGQLEASLAELGERVQLAEQAAAEAEQLGPAADDLRADQDKLAEELVDATASVAAARQQAGDAAAALDRLDAELATAAAGCPSVAARHQGLHVTALASRSLAQALGVLAEASAGEQAACQRAERELAASGLSSLATARAAVLPAAEQASLAAQAGEWESRLAGLTAAVQADDLAGLDPDQAAAVAAAAQSSAADLAAAQEAERLARDSFQALTRRDERLGQRMTELTAAEEAADRTEEETGPVIRLAGLARGMDGHRRIALTTYVLRRWFEQVVQAANVRLAAMSAGRYELVRTEEGESKRQRTGLTLAVIDRHTGEERSPRSLSGGETFYTSLALALGLADVVRAEAGGVELDTLFIDEGFGTLDAQTLDQVMAVIDELRDRGRAVGIVSHVADLKDRVYERLEVRRLPDGSSAATVVA